DIVMAIENGRFCRQRHANSALVRGCLTPHSRPTLAEIRAVGTPKPDLPVKNANSPASETGLPVSCAGKRGQ
ncbi:MAG: hypothetical protein ACP5EN_10625, partial [Rhodovulum sp.]